MSNKKKVEKKDNVDVEDVDQDYQPLSEKKFLVEEEPEDADPVTPIEAKKVEVVRLRGRPRLTEEQKEEKRRIAREKARATRAAKKAAVPEEEKKIHAEEVKRARYKNLMKAQQVLAARLAAGVPFSSAERSGPPSKPAGKKEGVPQEKKEEKTKVADDGLPVEQPKLRKTKKTVVDEEESDSDSEEEIVIKKRSPKKEKLQSKLTELEKTVESLRTTKAAPVVTPAKQKEIDLLKAMMGTH